MLADGSAAVREITIAENKRAVQFDFILRPVRYGYEEDDERRVLRTDILSGRRITGVVIRESLWTAKPALGGCVNNIPMSRRTISGSPYFQYTDPSRWGNSYGFVRSRRENWIVRMRQPHRGCIPLSIRTEG